MGESESAYSVARAAALLGVSTDTVYRGLGTKYRATSGDAGTRRVDAADVERARAALLRRLDAVDARPEFSDRAMEFPDAADADIGPERHITEGPDQRDEEIARLRARTVELEEIARALRRMVDDGLRVIDQQLAPDTLND